MTIAYNVVNYNLSVMMIHHIMGTCEEIEFTKTRHKVSHRHYGVAKILKSIDYVIFASLMRNNVNDSLMLFSIVA